MPKISRLIVTTAGLAALAVFSLPAVPAEAKPAPSLAEAKKQLAKLNDQVDQLANRYNKAVEDWKAAKSRLNALNKSVTAERRTFNQLHERVAQLAASAYKSGGDAGVIPQVLAAKDPEAVLDQMSVIAQVSHNRTTELAQYLASAQRLEREQALAQQAAEQLAERKAQIDRQKKAANKAIRQQMKLIERIGSNIDPGSSKANCSALAFGRAERVLRFACAQLGKPYVFGGAGPNVWDCSGLTMMAYKQVGININHYVPDQYAASRHISKAELQPGDLVFFHDLGHVGIYLGNGKFIHAPHTGDVVKVSSLNDAWYTSTWVGGGRLL